tara:strand:- start:3599 stop:3967 length:369 start_codon:yes stop_codon:yes gene_type:complete
MPFNQADILVTRFGTKSLTKGCVKVTIEGINVPFGYLKEEASNKAPLYKLVCRQQYGVHLEPVDQPDGMVGPMSNGVYADVSGGCSAFIKPKIEKLLGYPCPDLIPVFDRFETQEQYNSNCI